MDVSDEARQSEESQQTEDLGEAHDAESAGGAVHVRGLVPGLQVDDEEDVVDGDGGDEVHQEPGAEVMHADISGVQDDLAVLSRDARAEIEDQVHEEESVRQDVKGDPGHGVLVFKEGDSPGQNDQIAHHQQEHHKVPVKPGQKRSGGRLRLCRCKAVRILFLFTCTTKPLTLFHYCYAGMQLVHIRNQLFVH